MLRLPDTLNKISHNIQKTSFKGKFSKVMKTGDLQIGNPEQLLFYEGCD